MIESLAAGTPGDRHTPGLRPENTDDGATGFLRGGIRELAAALNRAGTLDRRGCQRAAATRFSAQRMVSEHLRLYQEALGEQGGGEKARNPAAPKSPGPRPACLPYSLGSPGPAFSSSRTRREVCCESWVSSSDIGCSLALLDSRGFSIRFPPVGVVPGHSGAPEEPTAPASPPVSSVTVHRRILGTHANPGASWVHACGAHGCLA